MVENIRTPEELEAYAEHIDSTLYDVALEILGHFQDEHAQYKSGKVDKASFDARWDRAFVHYIIKAVNDRPVGVAAPQGERITPTGFRIAEVKTQPPEWQKDMHYDMAGKIARVYENAILIARHDPGCDLSMNAMTFTPEFSGRPLDEASIGMIREKVFSKYSVNFPKGHVVDACIQVATEKTYHPVSRWLDGLVWDGRERVKDIAETCLGIKDDADGIYREIVTCWLVGAVVRAMKPGSKHDSLLVLVGAQGIRKSTFFSVLAGEWFGDSYMDLRNKDAVLQLYRAWIYEWPEIDRITSGNRFSASETKAFITQACDLIRPPYARTTQSFLRHSIIAGTTNEPKYLTDMSGNRRFWSIPCRRKIDTEWLATNRDQLWAECVDMYRNGRKWWLDDTAADRMGDMSNDYAMFDPWSIPIEGWIKGNAKFTSSDIYRHALEVPEKEWHTGSARRIAAILKSLGYVQSRAGKDRTRHWERVEST